MAFQMGTISRRNYCILSQPDIEPEINEKILKKKFTTLRNIKNVHSLLFPRESVTLNAIHLSE